MADLADPTIDPALEAALRRALRDEADAVPFRVRADAVRAAAARAASRRRRLPVVLAASLAIVAVGAIAVALTSRPAVDVGAQPAVDLSGLPSYERLLEVSVQGRELARGEGVVEAGPADLPVTAVAGFHPAEVVFACSGSGVTLSAGDGSPVQGPMGGPEFDCSAGATRTWIAGASALGVAAEGLRIAADAGTVWRAVVIGLPDTADVIAGSEPVAGLPSFEELAERTPSLPELARASAAAAAESRHYRVLGLGEAVAMQSVLACSGGPLTLVWADGPGWSAEEAGGTVPCDGAPLHLGWNRGPQTADASELHVYAPPGTAWIMLVEDLGGPATPQPAP